VAKAIRNALAGLPAMSLTLDNGSEFAAYTQRRLPVVFADPGKEREYEWLESPVCATSNPFNEPFR